MNPLLQHITVWAAVGAVIGVAAAAGTRRLLVLDNRPTALALVVSGALLTGATFAIVATRYSGFELLAYSYLAAIGVVLSTIDILERRLPGLLTSPSYAVIGGLVGASAAHTNDPAPLVRSLAAAAVLVVAYLLVALASRGGLGAGDVKLTGLLGLALGWQSWTAVLGGTVAAWVADALFLLVARLVHAGGRREVPMGPFLIGGAGLALVIG
jgi:leader peptidase (prepilin peptidase) / N-methyltransferase